MLHPRVADGIRRHRRVDGLTDRHPRHVHLRAHFGAGHRRVAGIVLDVLFDYFLSRHWHRFSSYPRREFVDGVYHVLGAPDAPLPEPLARVAGGWVDADWLSVYGSWEGVEAVLARMGRRSRRGLDLTAALASVEGQVDHMEQEFLVLFADLQAELDGLGNRDQSAESLKPGSHSERSNNDDPDR